MTMSMETADGTKTRMSQSSRDSMHARLGVVTKQKKQTVGAGTTWGMMAFWKSWRGQARASKCFGMEVTFGGGDAFGVGGVEWAAP